VAQSTARPLETYAAVAIVYLAIVSAVTLGQAALERRLDRSRRTPVSGRGVVARETDGPHLSDPAPPAGDTLLDVRGIVRRHGGFTALHATSLAIRRGEVVAVLGASGSGKSTLLRCLNWLDPPDEGIVLLASRPVGAWLDPSGGRRDLPSAEQAAMRARFGMVFQRFHLFPHLTAAENVALAPRRVRGLTRNRAMSEARTLLARFGLAAEAERYPATLSGGQRQRVAIARGLAMTPEVLLFDEPTSALDPESVREVLAAIRTLADGRTTMLIATHELAFARAVATRVLFLAEGRIVEDAQARRFFAGPVHPAARAFLARHLDGRLS
jgi:polar amino acid transport system permease protein